MPETTVPPTGLTIISGELGGVLSITITLESVVAVTAKPLIPSDDSKLIAKLTSPLGADSFIRSLDRQDFPSSRFSYSTNPSSTALPLIDHDTEG